MERCRSGLFCDSLFCDSLSCDSFPSLPVNFMIRGQLRGHDDTPFGRPTLGRPIGRPVVGRPNGVFGGLSYYQLVILFFNIVPLMMEITFPRLTNQVQTLARGVLRLQWQDKQIKHIQ
jgi:hypothetical protein